MTANAIRLRRHRERTAAGKFVIVSKWERWTTALLDANFV